jgi:MoaA/NifB/PqqE/SkfB family radical SAM enzyme
VKKHERARALRRITFLLWRLFLCGRYDFVYDQMPISLRDMSWPRRLNLIRSGLNMLHRKARPWSMPLHMQFEFTNYCNLRCPVCPTGSGELTRRKCAMDPQLFRGVMAEVSPYLLTTSLWGWGESLLHPALGDMLRVAADSGVVTFLSTNGQHLNHPSVIESIQAAPPSYLIVAIDGLTDETHSAFRKGAKLEEALSGVRRLAEWKKRCHLRLPILHMRFMVMKHNEHELVDSERFAFDQGFDMLTLRALSIVDSERAVRVHTQLVPDTPQVSAYKYEQGVRIHRSDFICMQPFWFPSLLADGTVVFCEQDFNGTDALGQAGRDVTFQDLWRGKRAAAMRKTIRRHPESRSYCRNCPAWDRALTDTSVSGSFLRPEILNPLIVGKEGLRG